MIDNVKILTTQILSDNWYTLKKITYEYLKKDGTWQTQNREAYDRGNGATILLYNKEQQTVILTRQFRLPTFINGNHSGMLIEACAGLLDLLLTQIFYSLTGKRLTHDKAVGILAKLFLVQVGHLIFFPNDLLISLSTLPLVVMMEASLEFDYCYVLIYTAFAIVFL